MNDENLCLPYTRKWVEASVISILETTAADGKNNQKFSVFNVKSNGCVEINNGFFI